MAKVIETKTETIKTITLQLNEAETYILKKILAKVSGEYGISTPRSVANNIYEALSGFGNTSPWGREMKVSFKYENIHLSID